MESPLNVIKKLIKETDSGVMEKDSIFAPVVISIMPDIIPCEISVKPGIAPNIIFGMYDRQ